VNADGASPNCAQEGEVDVTLAVDLKPMGVPYLRPPSDHSASYVDLRREPHRINELPELREWPALRDALAKINAEGSMFKTLGCACWFHKVEPPALPIKCVAYVGFCYADVRGNLRPEPMYELFHCFCERVQPVENSEPVVRFEVRRTAFYNENNQLGWSLDYFMLGQGIDRNAALVAPTAALSALVNFLGEVSAQLAAMTEEQAGSTETAGVPEPV
jgi:hypothetical protein